MSMDSWIFGKVSAVGVMVLHTYIYWINIDRMINDARKKPSLEKYSPLTLLQGFEMLACERVMETEHKLLFLTPLL